MQQDLFEMSIPKKIPGLFYLDNFISDQEEINLIEKIDQAPWGGVLKRRTQQYGYKYDYRHKTISENMKIGPLPNFLMNLAEKLVNKKLISKMPDQAIINEYLPGQGIGAHIDCETCFDAEIASISLISDCTMNFVETKTKKSHFQILKKKSLLILSNEARYNWSHEIKPCYKNGERISITFRKVI